MRWQKIVIFSAIFFKIPYLNGFFKLFFLRFLHFYLFLFPSCFLFSANLQVVSCLLHIRATNSLILTFSVIFRLEHSFRTFKIIFSFRSDKLASSSYTSTCNLFVHHYGNPVSFSRFCQKMRLNDIDPTALSDYNQHIF